MSLVDQTAARQWLANRIVVFTQRAEGGTDITFSLRGCNGNSQAVETLKDKLHAAFPDAQTAPNDVLPVTKTTPNGDDLHLQVPVPAAPCTVLSGLRPQQQGVSA